MSSTTHPKALARSRQRSPNLPAVSTRTLSPGEVRFETEPSITPVPEEASTRTSFRVPINSFMSASTRAYRARKSAVRWCMANEAMAVCAAGSMGVGPGVKRRFLRNIYQGFLCLEDRFSLPESGPIHHGTGGCASVRKEMPCTASRVRRVGRRVRCSSEWGGAGLQACIQLLFLRWASAPGTSAAEAAVHTLNGSAKALFHPKLKSSEVRIQNQTLRRS